MYGHYYNPYQPQQQNLTNPYQSRLNSLQGDFNNRYEIIRVNGRNGAEAFNLPPNSSVMLLDETAPIVWLAQTDGAGYKTLTPYSITPYQAQQPVDLNSLEERIKRLEEKVNEQSDVTSVKSKKSGKPTAESE